MCAQDYKPKYNKVQKKKHECSEEKLAKFLCDNLQYVVEIVLILHRYIDSVAEQVSLSDSSFQISNHLMTN